jgi:hypothetical protein
MKELTLAFAFAAALSVPAFAEPGRGDGWGRGDGGGRDHGGVHGAPGPIAGAGLPVLAVGYGIYWLVRRRKTGQS